MWAAERPLCVNVTLFLLLAAGLPTLLVTFPQRGPCQPRATSESACPVNQLADGGVAGTQGDETARREYQAFLLEDASQRFQPRKMVEWAGYPGPWIENLFLDYWKVAYAAGTDMGKRLYLPVLFFDCYRECESEQNSQFGTYLDGLRREFRYFSVLMTDKGFDQLGMRIPAGLDLMVFGSGGTTRGVRSVPIPLLMEALQPQGLPKDIHVSFVGTTTTHKLREEMQAQLADQGYQFEVSGVDGAETARIMERSNFTLAPRGFGSTSWRLYQALQLGSIPIYIWDYDYFLAFPDIINWNSIAIAAHRREIDGIPQRVAEFDVPKAQALLAQYRHVWTYNFTIDYIVTRLRNERCNPVPFAFHRDMPPGVQ